MTRFTFTRQFTLAAVAAIVVVVGAACGGGSAGRRSARAAELPTLAQPIVSRLIGRDMPSLAATALKGGFRMINQRQRLVARFYRSGAVVQSAGGGWFGLALRGVGHGHLIDPARSAALRAHQNVVVYGRGPLTEWYANGPLGLEQGFTVRRTPVGPGTGPLTLALALRGSLPASLGAAGLLLRAGATALRYTLPVASDATGRALRAWLELHGRSLLLRVDDRGARYPVRIDPFVRQATLHASDAVRGSFGFHFGAAVAVSGDTIAVGAPDAGVGTGKPEGAVYVFTKPASGWADATETAKLTASDGGSNDQLGASVAISGDTIVAGAPGALRNDHQFQGAAYVFTKPATGWTSHTQTAELTASGGAAGDVLGESVAIAGATIVAGAPGVAVAGRAHQGAVYVFTEPAGGWASEPETATLTASDGVAEDGLGGRVAISGQTVVATGGDAAYVFVESQAGWAAATHQQAKLTAPGQNLVSVAIDGTTIVSGSTGAQSDSSPGEAEVFVEPGSGWADAAPTASLTPTDARIGANFGFSVAVQGGTVLVGAPFASPASTFEAGAAYVYERGAGGWADQAASAAVLEPSPGFGDELGYAVAVADSSTLLAGAPLATAGNVQQGVAYVFTGSQAPAPAPPAATITSPSDGTVYVQGQAITAAYACTEGTGGPGIATCTGPVSNGAPIDTSILGAHTFTVTATSQDGQSATTVHHYTVNPRFTPPPSPVPTPPPSTTTTGPHLPAPPPIQCLTGDGKYPDFSGTGTSPDYTLTDPTPQPSGALEQTVSFGLTGQAGGMYVTTGGCWGYQGHVAGPARNGYPDHREFDTYGEVNLNGVILSPINGHGGAPALLHVGTDGGIYATGDDTRYDIDVTTPEGSRLTVGLVDLGSAPWNWDGHITSVIGQFGPAPGGPCPFGQPIAGGTVTAAGVGRAVVTAYVQLPRLFSSSPDGAPPPTSNLNYGPYTNPDAPSATPGGGGGGSGGNLGAGNCVQTHTHCGHSLEAADASAGACETGSGLGASPAPATPGAPAGGPVRGPLHLTVPELYLGPLRLTNVFLDYDPVKDVWSGGGDAQVGGFELKAAPPPPDDGLGLHSDGSFDHGGASLSDRAGVPLFPGVDLTELGVSFALDPVRFTGDGTISVAGGLATVHGAVLVVFANSSHPYTYRPDALLGVPQLQTDTASNPITSTAIGLSGDVALHLPVVGDASLAHGYVFYIAPSYFEFAGEFMFPSGSQDIGVSVDGKVKGALDTSSRLFSLAGDLSVCANFPDPVGSQCIGLSGAVSSAGFGACGHFNTVLHNFDIGFNYLYSGGLTIYLDGCSLGPVIIDVRAQRGVGARVATPVGFDLPPGLPSASVTVTGAGGAPRVAITGPDGERAVGDASGRAVDGGRFVILPMRGLHETVIGIGHPAGGHWTIAPAPGSVPITGVSHADGLPPARVSAAVRRHGVRWLLSYRVRPRDGQKVTFAERAGQVFHVLGPARGAHGTLAFTPADAATRRRQIVALISLSGLQTQTLVAGHYVAPPRRRAGAVRGLHLSRHGGSVTVSWARASDARGYVVTVALSDGQVLSLSTPATQHAVIVPAAVRGLGARVSVMALGADGGAGPARSARLAPAAAPARVTGITATRTARGVVVRWHRVRGAVRYLVQLIVQGRRGVRYAELSALPRLRPSRDLLALTRGTRVTITVRAMDGDGKLGPAGSAIYRATRR